MSTSMVDLKLTSAVVIGIVYVQVNETDNLYTMYLTKNDGSRISTKVRTRLLLHCKVNAFFWFLQIFQQLFSKKVANPCDFGSLCKHICAK